MPAIAEPPKRVHETHDRLTGPPGIYRILPQGVGFEPYIKLQKDLKRSLSISTYLSDADRHQSIGWYATILNLRSPWVVKFRCRGQTSPREPRPGTELNTVPC